jgi:hypothetical protein
MEKNYVSGQKKILVINSEGQYYGQHFLFQIFSPLLQSIKSMAMVLEGDP